MSSQDNLLAPQGEQSHPRDPPSRSNSGLESVDSNTSVSVTSSNNDTTNHENASNKITKKKKKKIRPKLQPITSPQKSYTGDLSFEDQEDDVNALFGGGYNAGGSRRDSAKVVSLDKKKITPIVPDEVGDSCNDNNGNETKGSHDVVARAESDIQQLLVRSGGNPIAESDEEKVKANPLKKFGTTTETLELLDKTTTTASATATQQSMSCSPESSQSGNNSDTTRTTTSETYCTPNATNTANNYDIQDDGKEDGKEDLDDVDTAKLSQPALMEGGDQSENQQSVPQSSLQHDQNHQQHKKKSHNNRQESEQITPREQQEYNSIHEDNHNVPPRTPQELSNYDINDMSSFQTPTKSSSREYENDEETKSPSSKTTKSPSSSLAAAAAAGGQDNDREGDDEGMKGGENEGTISNATVKKNKRKSKTIKPHPSDFKLQPRSTLFSPDKVPDTPDEDGWCAFGFGLVKTPSEDEDEEEDGDFRAGGDAGGGLKSIQKITMDDISIQSAERNGGGGEDGQGDTMNFEPQITTTPQISNRGAKEIVPQLADDSPLIMPHRHPSSDSFLSDDEGSKGSSSESEGDLPFRRGSTPSDGLLGEDLNKDEVDEDDEHEVEFGDDENSRHLQHSYPKDKLEEFVKTRLTTKSLDEDDDDDDNEEEKTPPLEFDDLAYSLDQEEPIFERKMSSNTTQSNLSSISQPSSVSFNDSALEIKTSSTMESTGRKSETVHLLGNRCSSNIRSSSDEDIDEEEGSVNSESTFTASDGESSYFSAKRASMESQNQQQQPLHHYHHFHPQNFRHHLQQPHPPAQYGQPPYYYPIQYPPPFSQPIPLNPYSQTLQQSQTFQHERLLQSTPFSPAASDGNQRKPPARPVNLPLRSNAAPVHSSSGGFGGAMRQAVEMKLSLSASEEDDDDNDEKCGGGDGTKDVLRIKADEVEEGKGLDLFHRSNSQGKERLSCSSSIVERASSDEDEGADLSPSRLDSPSKSDQNKSTTPFSNGSASTDDAGVLNELSAYIVVERAGESIANASGRITPVEGRHVASVLKEEDLEPSNSNIETPTPTHAGGARNFYVDTQSAIMAASTQVSATKPLAHVNSPYLNQLRGNWSALSGGSNVGDTGSVNSAVHKSPRGAFNETEVKSLREPASQKPYMEMQYQTSPHTPKSRLLHLQPSWGSDGRPGGQSSVEPTSLAYSDEDEIEGRAGVKASPLQNQGHNGGDGNERVVGGQPQDGENKFKVYSSRWIMLLYMSVLNLLSDWTCYSIAPIAMLTIEKFGNDVDPESLVTIFLSANAIASACEPAILGRLGLRRTVVFGAMLLMIGSIIKSGGAPLMGQSLGEGDGWRVYLGFFLVGLSQPLYQCTPALLSASWFPENERTMATGVALNSNQLGIGFAFVFGTLLVASVDDIVPYFQFLSFIATVAFVGCALQFDDAPPTPPSDTARVIRGTLEMKIPNLPSLFFVRGSDEKNDKEPIDISSKSSVSSSRHSGSNKQDKRKVKDGSKQRRRSSNEEQRKSRRRRESKDGKKRSEKKKRGSSGSANPSNAPLLPRAMDNDALSLVASAPSPMLPGPVGRDTTDLAVQYGSTDVHPVHVLETPNDRISDGSDAATSSPFPNLHGYYAQQGGMMYQPGFGYYGFHPENNLPSTMDEGVEPVMTQTPHQLDINVRDDQILLSFKACFARKGFSHCVVAFTTSGIVINTLSTFMDYLVRLQGAGRRYVGIVGGTFQLLIMIASMIFGSWTDRSRKYYFMILFMLITGAFALSVCSLNLDDDRGGDLRLTLLVVAILAGPLQPLSTELGVEVVYPLSENTVLVIQQLFSNLLSAAFIPVFKMLRDFGTVSDVSTASKMFEVPQYTFSFYMLVVIHALATIYFASFNGQYLRFEQENIKKREKEKKRLDSEIQNHYPYYGLAGGRVAVIDENFPFLIPQNYMPLA